MEDTSMITQLLESFEDLDIHDPDLDDKLEEIMEEQELNKFQQ